MNLNYLTKHVIKFSFIIISICVVAFFFKNTINEFKIFGRFLDLILNGDQSGRMVKNATAITLINGSYIHYLIGVPTRLYAETSVSISDNAVLMRFLDSGVFFCLIYISLVFMQLHVKYRPTLNMYLYKIIILVTCLLNNATAWIPWVYFSILGYFIIIENEKV